MDLITLADVRTLLGHLLKETQARATRQHVKVELKKAAARGDTTQVSIAPQTVLILETSSAG
jgi:hypothetical protein